MAKIDLPDAPPPLGIFTEPMEMFMKSRGWECNGTYAENDLCFEFPASFRGVRDQTQIFSLGELSLITLDCRFVVTQRGLRAAIIMCGVESGCPKHASCRFKFRPGRGRSLPQLLQALEDHASRLDPAEVVCCVLFGDCGKLISTLQGARDDADEPGDALTSA